LKIKYSSLAEYNDWKKIDDLYERLTPLGIMEAQLKAPLKPLDTIVLRCSKGFRVALIMPRNARLSDGYLHQTKQ